MTGTVTPRTASASSPCGCHDAQLVVRLGQHDGDTVRGSNVEGSGRDVVERRARTGAPASSDSVDLGDRFEQLLAPLALVVEAGVLDRDARRDRERADELFVDLRELVGTLLLAQVEVSEHCVPDPDGDAEERRHRRMVRREPERRPDAAVRSASRSGRGSRISRPRIPRPSGSRPIRSRVASSIADGDELDQVLTVGTEDAERSVLWRRPTGTRPRRSSAAPREGRGRCRP